MIRSEIDGSHVSFNIITNEPILSCLMPLHHEKVIKIEQADNSPLPVKITPEGTYYQINVGNVVWPLTAYIQNGKPEPTRVLITLDDYEEVAEQERLRRIEKFNSSPPKPLFSDLEEDGY